MSSCPRQLELEDKWVLSKLNTLVKEVTDNMDAFEIGVAVRKGLRLHLGHLLRLVSSSCARPA